MEVFWFALLNWFIKLISAKMGNIRTTLNNMPDTIQKVGNLLRDSASAF
jgi:hypothetical protein